MASKKQAIALLLATLGHFSASAVRADYFPVADGDQPPAEVSLISGIGSADALVVSEMTGQAVEDWCATAKPADPSCLAQQNALIGQEYRATANCAAGTMITPLGEELKWIGLNHQGRHFNRFYVFENMASGEKSTFDPNGNGARIMAQWMSLCPFGLPYSQLPREAKLDPVQSYPRLREMADTPMGELARHNGSVVKLDFDLGTIHYVEPKYASIAANTVLFRGSISLEPGVPTRGMAYVFKQGCTPQAYYVEGFHDAAQHQLVLNGRAPVWDGCKVKSLSATSKHARLLFEFSE